MPPSHTLLRLPNITAWCGNDVSRTYRVLCRQSGVTALLENSHTHCTNFDTRSVNCDEPSTGTHTPILMDPASKFCSTVPFLEPAD